MPTDPTPTMTVAPSRSDATVAGSLAPSKAAGFVVGLGVDARATACPVAA